MDLYSKEPRILKKLVFMNILTTIYGKYKHPTQILVSNQHKYNLNDKRKKKKGKKRGGGGN